jgi:hypothetical protein
MIKDKNRDGTSRISGTLLLGIIGIVAVVVIAAGIFLAQPGAAPATPAPPEPKTLLANVIENLRLTKSFKLLIEQTGAPYNFMITLDEGASSVSAVMQRAEGQFVNPNILYADTRLKVSALPAMGVEIFARGEDQWFRLGGSAWINYPVAEGFDPGRLIEENSGFSQALTQLDRLEFITNTTLDDGTPVYHLRGIAKGQVINDLMFGLLQVWMDNITVDVYIDQATVLPALLVMTLPDTATEDVPENTQWTIEVYDVNAESQIVYPDEQ